MIRLVVHGEPKGKGRPRFNMKTGRTYTPADTAAAENRVVQVWLAEGSPTIEGPVACRVEVVMHRPKSHFRKDGSLSKAGLESAYPTRGDADNFLKLPLDALNKKAYPDDKHVVRAEVVKRWARGNEMEQTVVELRPAA